VSTTPSSPVSSAARPTAPCGFGSAVGSPANRTRQAPGARPWTARARRWVVHRRQDRQRALRRPTR
jgi:hypothetical protein